MPSYDYHLFNIFDAITKGDEVELLKNIRKVPLYIIDEYSKDIINMLLDTENVNMLHIFIIYGLDCNCLINILEGECYSAFIDHFAHGEYDDYLENSVFNIIISNLNTIYDSLNKWYINPIYYAIKNDCIDVLKVFIKYGIIPLQMYFEQSLMSGKQQFIKYEKLKDRICPETGYSMKKPVFYNYKYIDKSELLYAGIPESDFHKDDYLESILDKWGVEDIDTLDFNEEELKQFEIFDENIVHINMFINDELSMHYNYISKKKIDISVVYPRKYNEILKTIILILNRYNDSDHKYYLPEELWLCIIIPMFVTNY